MVNRLGVIDDHLGEEIQIADYRAENVVEIVRDPARKMPDGLHLLCLLQGRFGLLAHGHVAHRHNQNRTRGRSVRAQAHLERKLAPVLAESKQLLQLILLRADTHPNVGRVT